MLRVMLQARGETTGKKRSMGDLNRSEIPTVADCPSLIHVRMSIARNFP